MRLVAMFTGLLLVAGPVFAGKPLVLEKWPAPSPCADCSFIWFDGLQMKLPIRWLRRVSVLNGGNVALGLSDRRDDDKHAVVFLSLKRRHFSGAFHKKGWLKPFSVTTEEAFFDLLGDPERRGRHVSIMRKVMRLEKGVVKFSKTMKGRLTVYFVQRHDKKENEVVILVDKGKHLYLVGGPVSRDFYRALLANLSVFGKDR